MPSPNPADFAAEPPLQAGDIFLVRDAGPVSRICRPLTGAIGESRARCDHVGVVVRGGPFGEAVVVEARRTPRRRRLVKGYANTRAEVAVYRPRNLSDDERRLVIHTAQAHVSRKHGYLDNLAHSLDWLLKGSHVFRRLAGIENYPVSSWVVAHAFARADKDFDVEEGAATPDDIWDFVTEETDKYECVRELSPIGGGEDPV